MKVKTTLIALILCLVCNAFLPLLSFNTLPSTPNAYTALAFKPTPTNKNTNNNNTAPISKPPVVVNHPPVVKVGPDQTVDENATVILVGVAIDPDPSDKLSYSWIQIAGPAVILNAPTTASPTFTAPSNISADTHLKFALTARDNKGAESNNTAIVTITVKHINRSPVANAGQNQTVDEGYVVSLDGSKSKDPDGDPITYLWTQTAGPSVTLNGADKRITTFTAPSNISSDTDLAFKLTVADNKNATNTSTVKVTDKYIPPPNKPPVANAGSNQTVNAGDNVALDGSASRDPDGNITSYSWTQTAGPAVTLNGADTATPSFTAPRVSSDTTMKFSLTVMDDKKAANNNPAIVSVTVKAVVPSSSTAAVPGNMTNATAPTATPPAANMTSIQSNQSNINQATDYQFVRKWGSTGPSDVAVDSSGNNVYVANYDNNRIQKFDSNGAFITMWGSYGNADGQFYNPNGIALDSYGNVFVAEQSNNRIQKFDSSGTFITKWGSYGSGDGQFYNPSGVAVDSSGNVYVADNGNNRIQKFDSSGTFITKWGSYGSGDGQFYIPNGIAVDSSGNVYVADFGNNRIQKFDSSGTFITKWGSNGTADGQFSGASNVAVDSSGNVYVTDYSNNRIQKFDSSGIFITKWGSGIGTADGQFNVPDGIAVDSSGNVYVVDGGNDRIQVFAPSR